MIKRCIILILLLTPALAFSQSREDILVHIPAVIAARPDHAIFIQEHFQVEVSAANYTLTPTLYNADFVIRLEVSQNMVLYDDGVWDLPPEDEPQFLLQLTLMNNETNTEMLSFQYPFSELFDIYLFSLEMTYAAMANVPITRLGDLATDDDRWRNQWLYIAMSLNYPVITAYAIQPHPTMGYNTYIPPNESSARTLGNEVIPNPGVSLGVEFHFLDWMSAELGFNIRFGDPMAQNQFIPSISIQLKFPLKPENAKHIKISPFIMASASANTANTSDVITFPRYSVGGGAQFAVRAGQTSGFFVDVSYNHSLGTVVTRNPLGNDWEPNRINYARWVVSIGFGFKMGFMDRNPTLEDE